MTALWTAAEAAAATNGQVTGDWAASGVSIDTRTLVPGDLFVALADVRDGHDFVAKALEAGAAAALVSRVPDGVPAGAPLVVVPDVLAGLRDLARAARARTKARVLGITGSVGKTSTKEMLRVMLGGQGKVHAAEKSYNNHWGVPLTLARMPADTDYAVIEIGMNAPGEIAPLAELANLDVALITTVAPAHLAAFESVEGIAREKASILDGLRAGGTAVLNADVETAHVLFDRAAQSPVEVIGFGCGADCTARLLSADLRDQTTVVQARIGGTDLLAKLATPGMHFALNAVGALAAAAALGADPARAAMALGHWQPAGGRGARLRVVLDAIDTHLAFDLIDDAYNANPASVAAALDMLVAVAPSDGVGRITRGRRIAILGDMLELGPTEAELHAALASHPAMAGVDRVHCVGPRSRALWDALPPPKRGHAVDTAGELAAEAARLVDAGDIVLVKGSLGIGLAPVVAALRNLGQTAPETE